MPVNDQKVAPVQQDIAINLLTFDPENPRFPPEVAAGPVDQLMEKFIRDERLAELIGSIGDQGYFEGEPLLVVESGDGRFVVIEGNRRLAALKLLSGQVPVPDGRPSIDEACRNAPNKPTSVPCLIFPARDDILRYLGFRHITGIKAWGSLQKARYLKQIRDKFFSRVPPAQLLKNLAREIGSRSDYVGQMLASLNIYEMAERENFYKVDGLSPDSIEFSVLATALSYTNLIEYIGLDHRTDMVGANVVEQHLKNLLSWMFVAKADQKPILGDSRNLRKLAEIVKSPQAHDSLLNNGNLEAAYQLSKGPSSALTLMLKDIERKLAQAWEWLPLVSSPEGGDEERAEAIRKRALEIREAIKAKRAADE